MIIQSRLGRVLGRDRLVSSSDRGLKQLADKHSRDSIEQACRTAHSYGAYRLQTVRKLIGQNAPVQTQFEFLDEHPVIRPLANYSEFVKSALRKEQNR